MLLSHPNVAQAIVFAVTDATFGHLPGAIIDYCAVDNSHNVGSNHNLHCDHHKMAIDIDVVNLQLSQLVESTLARFKRPRQFFVWPQNVVSSGLKVPRKSIIAAIQPQISASKTAQ